MMIFLFVLSLLVNGVLGFLLYVFLKRLFQFDGFVNTISQGLDDYGVFLVRKTSRGILEDHPEIKEFHEKTIAMIKMIDSWSHVWAKGLDPKKKSTAERFSKEPGE